MISLAENVCLITGASRGIGQAIAKELGRLGATIVGTATSESGSAAISKKFRSEHILGEGMQLDVTQEDSVRSVIERIGDTYGVPTVLINNAGITRDNLFLRMKEDEWDDIIEINLKSIYRVSKACLRGMIKAKVGRIINIGSVVGDTGNPGQCNYAAAKAGMIGFTKSLAREVGSRNITVNIVAPGFIDTDMTRELSESQREELQKNIPLGRLGSPQEVAKAVAFLASPMADYITGTTLHVNGGMYM